MKRSPHSLVPHPCFVCVLYFFAATNLKFPRHALFSNIQQQARAREGDGGQIDKESNGSSACDDGSVGVVLLLLAALINHGALGGEDACGCVTSAVFCLSESQDLRVTAAGMVVLNTSLSNRCSDGNTGDGGVARGQASAAAAAASSCVLAAVESLLQLRELDKKGGPDRSHAAVFGLGGGAAVGPCLPATCTVAGAPIARERLDGCGFGAPLGGMLDAPASLLARAVATGRMKTAGGAASNNALVMQEAAGRLSHQTLWMQVCDQLERGGGGELSPVGLACALRYLDGVLVAAPGDVDFAELMLQKGKDGDGGECLLGVICSSVLGRLHLQAVAEWPRAEGGGGGGGGGITAVAAIVKAAVGVLQAPLAADRSREALLRVQQAMHAQGLVAALLGATRVLCQDDAGERVGGSREREGGTVAAGDEAAAARERERDDALCACVDLLSRLVLLSPHFSVQFLGEGGLADLVSAGALSGTSPAPLVTSALVIASQLARASADNYARLRAAGVDSSLGPLLAHPDPTVRAKACNLVGNLCRYSAFFYAALLQEDSAQCTSARGLADAQQADGSAPQARQEKEGGVRGRKVDGGEGRGGASPLSPPQGKSVVDYLVDLCADPDPSAKKFACFAVGNAAFHSDALYERLAPAVAPLVAALEDAEEKTRANAAGAIGNLVRNSGRLSGDLARRGGMAALLRLAACDLAASPRRIALFSLGTCCAYAPCREALAMLNEEEEEEECDHRRMPSGGLLADRQGSGHLGGGGDRSGWNVLDGGGLGGGGLGGGGRGVGLSSPAIPIAGAAEGAVVAPPGLERRLLELEHGGAAGAGDDVVRKYVARLRAKLAGPPQT